MRNRVLLWVTEQLIWMLLITWLGLNALFMITACYFAREGWDQAIAAEPMVFQPGVEMLRSYYDYIIR